MVCSDCADTVDCYTEWCIDGSQRVQWVGGELCSGGCAIAKGLCSTNQAEPSLQICVFTQCSLCAGWERCNERLTASSVDLTDSTVQRTLNFYFFKEKEISRRILVLNHVTISPSQVYWHFLRVVIKHHHPFRAVTPPTSVSSHVNLEGPVWLILTSSTFLIFSSRRGTYLVVHKRDLIPSS